MVYNYITFLPQTGCDIRSIFKPSEIDLNSEFLFFFSLDWLIYEHSLPKLFSDDIKIFKCPSLICPPTPYPINLYKVITQDYLNVN